MTSGDPRVLAAEVARLEREAAEVRRNLAALTGDDPDTPTATLVDRVRDELGWRRAETPHLISAGPGRGGFVVSVKGGHELMRALALEMAALLEVEGGPNYVQWDVKPAGQRKPYRLILVRPGGKSPHEIANEAVAEAALLRRQLREREAGS